MQPSITELFLRSHILLEMALKGYVRAADES